VKLVNWFTPIFCLNNSFVWHAADIKFPVDVDLVRSCLALESYIAFNAEIGELLFTEDLEDYLGQIFVTPPGLVTHPVNLTRRNTCRLFLLPRLVIIHIMIDWPKEKLRTAATWTAGAFLAGAAIASILLVRSCVNRPWDLEYEAIGEFLVAFVLAVEGFLALLELNSRREDRNQENIAKMIERVSEHNWAIISDEDCCAVIDQLQDLHSGDTAKDKTQYWAARAVHLSHVLLLRQVWELAGKTEDLEGQDGWVAFAKETAKQLFSASKPPGGNPNDWAASDLWEHLTQHREIHPKKFVEWLQDLADPNMTTDVGRARSK
jgi:hypothetical protein